MPKAGDLTPGKHESNKRGQLNEIQLHRKNKLPDRA